MLPPDPKDALWEDTIPCLHYWDIVFSPKGTFVNGPDAMNYFGPDIENSLTQRDRRWHEQFLHFELDD